MSHAAPVVARHPQLPAGWLLISVRLLRVLILLQCPTSLWVKLLNQKAPVMVLHENPFCGVKVPEVPTKHKYLQHLFYRESFKFAFFHFREQDITKNCGSVGLSDGNVGGSGRNSLNALIKHMYMLKSMLTSLGCLQCPYAQSDKIIISSRGNC